MLHVIYEKHVTRRRGWPLSGAFCRFTDLRIYGDNDGDGNNEGDNKEDDANFDTNHSINTHDFPYSNPRLVNRCQVCLKYFASKASLNIHKKQHCKRHFCKCEYCGKYFSNEVTLLDHIDNIHQKKQTYPCKHCGKSYSSTKSLDGHIRDCHENTISCDLCSKVYYSKKGLKYHKLTHAKILCFKCQFCELAFSKNSELVYHVRNSHWKLVALPCEKCGLFIDCRANLDIHIKSCRSANWQKYFFLIGNEI